MCLLAILSEPSQVYRIKPDCIIYKHKKCYLCFKAKIESFSVPGRPAGIKALPINDSCITTSWQPPRDPNGAITSYNLYYSNTSAAAQVRAISLQFYVSVFVLSVIIVWYKPGGIRCHTKFQILL